ncbi:hypothetical protein GCM10027200_12140 [Lentzea nigeriaca]
MTSPGELNRRLDTAAAHASANVPVVRPDDTVETALQGLLGKRFDSAAVLAVCRGDVLAGEKWRLQVPPTRHQRALFYYQQLRTRVAGDTSGNGAPRFRAAVTAARGWTSRTADRPTSSRRST